MHVWFIVHIQKQNNQNIAIHASPKKYTNHFNKKKPMMSENRDELLFISYM